MPLAWFSPISSHFSHFPYVTGTLWAAALVLNHRVGGFEQVLGPWGSFIWTLLRDQQSLLLPHPPLVFTARSYGALSSWFCWSPGLCSLAWGWDGSLPRCPSRFLSNTGECGTTHSASHHCHCLDAAITPRPLYPGSLSLPLLPFWMKFLL